MSGLGESHGEFLNVRGRGRGPARADAEADAESGDADADAAALAGESTGDGADEAGTGGADASVAPSGTSATVSRAVATTLSIREAPSRPSTRRSIDQGTEHFGEVSFTLPPDGSSRQGPKRKAGLLGRPVMDMSRRAADIGQCTNESSSLPGGAGGRSTKTTLRVEERTWPRWTSPPTPGTWPGDCSRRTICCGTRWSPRRSPRRSSRSSTRSSPSRGSTSARWGSGWGSTGPRSPR